MSFPFETVLSCYSATTCDKISSNKEDVKDTCYPKGRSWGGGGSTHTHTHIYIYICMCIYIHVCVSMHVCSQMWVDMCAPIWNGYVHARVLPLLTDLYVYIYTHSIPTNKYIYIYHTHTHIYIYRWKLGAGSTNGSDPWQSYRLHNNCGRARNAEGIGAETAGREIFLNQPRAG